MRARFQSICEKYGFKPSYLTNYEMAISPKFQEFARDILLRGTGEIGMHLHAWNSPPEYSLSENDELHHPYLIEYPRDVIRSKIAAMTELLEKLFDTKMLSHRAGRWGFNEFYAECLIEFGYQSDCSVTPLVSWQRHGGDPNGVGGVDYSSFPNRPYFLDTKDISKPGNSKLLEIPVSIESPYEESVEKILRITKRFNIIRRLIRHFFPPIVWLRPRGDNLRHMLRIVKSAVSDQREHLEFILHSSEFMPGGSPTFTTNSQIDRLYRHLEIVFAAVAKHFQGMTLSEFYRKYGK